MDAIVRMHRNYLDSIVTGRPGPSREEEIEFEAITIKLSGETRAESKTDAARSDSIVTLIQGEDEF